MPLMNDHAAVCWSVSGLVHAVADALKARFSSLTVRGEISGFSRAASGHCYFTLKDDTSQIRCAMFQRAASLLSFVPGNGDEVEVQGRLAIYEQRGDLQFIVEAMRPVGQGRLLEQFQQLKAKLGNEGLFDQERKRPITPYPEHIGVVSSLQAAALRDVLTALKRRAPHVHVVVYPASVQGRQAASELVGAIQQAQHRNEVDTLLVCRGGGSLEDLWSFNEEMVVRAIAACTIPVISGVGHETDFTLADFAADLRAPTPTAAAEMAARPQAELLKGLAKTAQQLKRQAHMQLDRSGQRIDHAVSLLQRPTALLHNQQRRLEKAAFALRTSAQNALRLQKQHVQFIEQRWPQLSLHRLQKNGADLNQLLIRWQQQAPVKLMQDQYRQVSQLAFRLQWQMRQQLDGYQSRFTQTEQALAQARDSRIGHVQQRLENLDLRLQAMNPSGILSRGYAWITNEQGQVLASAQQLNPGQRICAQFSDGSAVAQVEYINQELL